MSDSFRLSIRPMSHEDLPAVFCLHTEAIHNPWSIAQFAASIASEHLCLVATREARLLAYAISRLTGEEAELLTIATLKKSHRTGIAESLLGELLDRLVAQGGRQCFLEVMESNFAAIELYRQFGFKEVGQRPDYYRLPAGSFDAIVMRASLTMLNHEVN